MANKIKGSRKSNVSIIGTAILVVSFAQSAYALTKFEACVVNIANSKGIFTLADANKCYTKEFKGAQGADNNGFPIK